jgi:beta-phosphoglucomutase-like phosphatase (HAD superfamily)
MHARAVRARADDAECPALVHEKETIYRELFGDKFAEVAGFTAFAKAAAARGLKIAVGTAGDKHNIEFAMSRLKMDPLPLAIVGGDEGLTGKPTPAIFLEAARRIGVAPERCIVFEDAPFGIEAARRGGMRAVAVCSTHSAAELAGPHVIAAVRDYNELIQRISGDTRCCMREGQGQRAIRREDYPPRRTGSTPST